MRLINKKKRNQDPKLKIWKNKNEILLGEDILLRSPAGGVPARTVRKEVTTSFRPQNRVTDLQVKVKPLHQTELPAVLSSILEKDENLEVLELIEAHSTGFSGDGS